MQKTKYHRFKEIKFLFFLIVFGCAFLLGHELANAATLYFSPSSGNFTVGNIFTVSVLVNTQGKATNNAEAILNFPTDFLEVVSINKSGSIFSLWVEEPSFSNSAGTISLNGGLPTPGFNGSAGNIISIVFRAKRAGSASLVFSSAAVRANDGEGTNILTSSGNAQFNLGYVAPSVPEATTLVETAGVPAAPQISSSTHPDPNKWYAQKDAKFVWTLPKDATTVRLLVNKIPQYTPIVTYSPVISSKDIFGLEDGIWYFHVRLQNYAGWGAISHFRFQIDTEPPKPFSIEFPHGKEGDDSNPIVAFNTIDAYSGIDYYRVKIGEGDFFKLDPNLIISNPYALPPQNPGQRTILVQAFDKAGNTTSAVEEFTILSLQIPTITYYPKEVQEGDLLEIRGTTYPDASVDIFLKKEGEEIIKQTTRSNSLGDFTLIWSPKLTNGLYNMWSQVTNNRGAKSYESLSLSIVVKSSAIFQIGSFVVSYLSIIFLLISVLFALIIGSWYIWHRFTLFRKRLRKETKEVEESLRTAFDLLRKDVMEQIAQLDGKPDLSEQEKKIHDALQNSLESAEKFVRKEIEDIEKEVK